MSSVDRLAALIASRLARPNPIVPGAIVADGGLNADTPLVSVSVGGTTRRAVYLPPHAIEENGNVFVCRLGPDKAAPLAIIATNYPVAGGLGTGGLGNGPLGN